MIRLLEIEGKRFVSGLEWRVYNFEGDRSVSTAESGIDFESAAYITAKSESGQKGLLKHQRKGIIAGGYLISTDLLEESAPSDKELKGAISLMVHMYESVELEGDCILELKVDSRKSWLAIIVDGKPLPHEYTDITIPSGEAASAVNNLIHDLEEEGIRVVHRAIDSDEINFKNIKQGRLSKGKKGGDLQLPKIAAIILCAAAVGYNFYDIYSKEPLPSQNAKNKEEDLQRARKSYEDAVAADFGKATPQVYAAGVIKLLDAYPAAIAGWESTGVNCDLSQKKCIIKYESNGYERPSILSQAFSNNVDIGIDGKTALVSDRIAIAGATVDDIEIPNSNIVRKDLLDALSILRSPAFKMETNIKSPSKVEVSKASYLLRLGQVKTYSKGFLEVLGDIGDIRVAAKVLDVPGVRINELVINGSKFAMRGYYAFQ